MLHLRKKHKKAFIRNKSMNPKAQLTDTLPQAKKILIDGYRQMSPLQKMRCITAMTQAVQQMAQARILKQYGNISEHEL
jgi:hypothetical protein